MHLILLQIWGNDEASFFLRGVVLMVQLSQRKERARRCTNCRGRRSWFVRMEQAKRCLAEESPTRQLSHFLRSPYVEVLGASTTYVLPSSFSKRFEDHAPSAVSSLFYRLTVNEKTEKASSIE